MTKIKQIAFPPYVTSPHRTVDVTNSPQSERVVNFGVVDNKGRHVGATVQLFLEVYRDATPEEIQSHDVHVDGGKGYVRIFRVPPGTYWSFSVHAQRDGVDFGATQPMRTYATKDLRDAAVEEYIENACKRATKQWDHNPNMTRALDIAINQGFEPITQE